MQKEEILLAYDNGHLTVHIPGRGVRVIEGPDAQGVWSAKSEEDRYTFITDESGRVRTLMLIERIRNARID
jgi:hypothetical protein